MKTLSDILASLQAAKQAFTAEVIDSALKITMAGGETAYIPNKMSDKAYEAYHILLNIPLPAAVRPAAQPLRTEPALKAEPPLKAAPAAASPAHPAGGQIKAAPIIIAPDDYHEAPPGARDEDWSGEFFADRDERD